MNRISPLLLLFLTLLPAAAPARDWFVNKDTGSDQQEGTQGFPLKTAQEAVNRAEPGDRILLFPERSVYRQNIRIPSGKQGIVIEGNGVILSGSDPVPLADWESLGEDLHRIPTRQGEQDHYGLIVNGGPVRMGQTGQNPNPFPSAEELEPGEFRWDPGEDGNGWITYRGETEGVEIVTRENGFSTSGTVRNIKVFNLVAQHFLNDGFRIRGNSRGLQFFNIAALENFEQGFSASDTSSCWIQQGRFVGNGSGVVDSDQTDSYYEDCLIADNQSGEVKFMGGRHSLTRCEIRPGRNSSPLELFPGEESAENPQPVPTSLVIRAVKLDLSRATNREWIAGQGTTVFVDAASATQLASLALTKHPSARISRELYRVTPIGRLKDGSPLMTWVGGGTGAPRPDSYRIMHFDKHEPAEIASKISPENDWFGLMSPLPTGDFPPSGNAPDGQDEAAGAIWRWIGLTAPNAVFVPDSEEGLALAEALRNHPPANVGMVDVFVSSGDEDGETRTSVLPRNIDDQKSAKAEMLVRLQRTPREVFDQLATHYGFQFGGSYIDALALIAKLRNGTETRAVELARSRIDDPLPRNAGNLAGTLLYAEINEPWSVQRVRHVANLAFEEDGTPKEAMPGHNEMSDSVFMAGPLLAAAGRLTGEEKYYRQCARHVQFMQRLCLREDGLYRHSPLNEGAWGRGNGFPALGLAMVLDTLPKDHEIRPAMESSLQSHLEVLARHQDAEGMWHQLIDLPDSYAEFSSTCMIAYSIARGIDTGLLEESSWTPRLLLAWEAIKARISSDGRTLFNVCEGTGKQATLEGYYQRKAILGPDARGGAMAMLLSLEMIRFSEAEAP